MAEKKKDKTNVNVKMDSEIWDQFIGLAKLLKINRMQLLEESVRDRIKKHGVQDGN